MNLLYQNPVIQRIKLPRIFFILFTLLLCLAALDCASAQTHKLLAGTWRTSGSLGGNQIWMKELTFSYSNFELNGYPPLMTAGSYKIIEKQKNRIRIEFRYTSGHFKGRTEEIVFEIAEDKLSLRSDKGHVYNRIQKK